MQQANMRVNEDVMNQLFPIFLFLAIGSLGLFSFISVAVWSSARRRERETYYKTEMLKKIAETQGAGAPAALELLREQEKIGERRRREAAKLGGVVTAAVGIALMVFLRAVVQDQGPVYLSGLIPLLVGVALLVYAYLLAPAH
jgi:hypothetical protein